MMPPGPAKYALLYALLAGGLGANHASAMDLKVIPLEHRSAEAVIPLIKPFVTRDGGRVTGSGDRLIVQEPAADLPQLEALVRRIDTPLKRLLITVTQDVPPPGPPGDGDGDGDSAGGPARGPRTRVYTSDIGGRLSTPAPGMGRDGGRVYGTLSLDNDHPPQALRVLEDRWASFESTVRVPVLGQFLGVVGGSANTLNTIKYKALTTGFAVRARVHDQSVVLDIAPRSAERARRGGGAIKEQAIQTTVSGKLGQWIDIGGAVSEYNTHGEQGVHSTYPLSQDLEHVWVKVQTQ